MKIKKWYATTKLSFSEGRAKINIPLKKKSFVTDLDSLKEILNDYEKEEIQTKLSKQEIVMEKELEAYISDGLSHWKNRKWEPALDLYLSSRNISYADKEDTTGKIREKIIKKDYGTPVFITSAHTFKNTILLDYIDYKETENFYDMILRRKSVRDFDKLSKLSVDKFNIFTLEGTKKIKKTRELMIKEGNLLRSYASAFSFYFTIFNVEGFENGNYFLDIENSAMSLIKSGDFSHKLPEYLGEQNFSKSANFTLLLVANFGIYQWRYRHERALRNLYIEAGRVLEHFSIAGLKVGLQGVVTPALADRKLGEFLDLNLKEELPICSYTFGAESND